MSIIHLDRPFGDLQIEGHELVGPDDSRLGEAVVAIVGGVTWDAARFDLAPHLIGLCRTGIGVDAVDLAEATARGVAVTNTPEGPTVSTAEHAIALLFAVAKTLGPHAERLRQGSGNYAGLSTAIELDGLTIGLLGYGRIARRVARIAHGIGMRVIAHDPFVWATDDATELVELDALFAESHVLSLHAPLAPDTAEIMNEAAFAQCQPGAILINCARGGLVNHAALVAALDSGLIAAAGLDVTDPEPLPPDHTLLHRDNVIVTPHIASSTVVGRTRMLDLAVEQAHLILEGIKPTELVNTDLLSPHWNDLEV
ncbi:MAG: hydroxyacid dehydrogenase [Acidimicrobiales bacterium]|nr:hydroxyacid dehydrogenase [Acidimicrobiales bacterium]